MSGMFYRLEESDRQATLLALATLALHRPGWDSMLGMIAETLQGFELFVEFKRLNNDSVSELAVAQKRIRDLERDVHDLQTRQTI